jgi:hypothetical protein
MVINIFFDIIFANLYVAAKQIKMHGEIQTNGENVSPTGPFFGQTDFYQYPGGRNTTFGKSNQYPGPGGTVIFGAKDVQITGVQKGAKKSKQRKITTKWSWMKNPDMSAI